MIRRAEAADLGTLVRLVRAYYTYDGIEWNEERVRPALAQLLGDPGVGGAFLVDVDGRCRGYAGGSVCFDAEFGGRYVMLTDLYVEEGHRGAGYGKALLAAVEEMARASGVQVIEGQVMRGNERARAFYRSWGCTFPDRLLMSRKL